MYIVALNICIKVLLILFTLIILLILFKYIPGKLYLYRSL